MARCNKTWPVLKSYEAGFLRKIALPLGGIGTGTVSLGGRGNLFDWEVVNRPAKGFNPEHSFFALFAKEAGKEPVTRVIEGVIPAEDYDGAVGSCGVPNHGLPRFRKCSFAAAYPLGQVSLSDPDMPVDVRIEAFNPLTPPDADKSGIPVAVIRFVIENKTRRTVSAALCGNLKNFIGMDGSSGSPKQNMNVFQTAGDVQGVFLKSDGVDPKAEQWGTMAMAVLNGVGVTHRTSWKNYGWAVPVLDFWDDFSSDGRLEDRPVDGQDAPIASLATQFRLPARATRSVTFLITWHFPNRQTWTAHKVEEGSSCCGGDSNRIGNYYTTRYADAWEAAVRTAAALPALESETIRFVESISGSDLPEIVKDAALNNICNLRTQTSFRTEDGRLFAWEGCGDKGGCCHGSCTHVWNYESATAFLFGGLARSMRDIEFTEAMHDNGMMSFRVDLPLACHSRDFKYAAADGQMGCLIKLYRDWKLSGDAQMISKLWPNARKALEFCWIPGGWDADQDGVMEGCQHNTMDVEYYGPNGQMCCWYLGALRAGEEMARHVGDVTFADKCRSLFLRGRKWVDANLFNGEYYEQQIRPMKEGTVAAGCQLGAAKNPQNPDWQLGKACLVDQLVGQYLAHTCGLGHLLDPGHVKTALRNVMRFNFRQMYGHFNNMRSFAMNDEYALLMATYPKGARPQMPFPYFAEVMTGFEYSAAVGMLYEGLTADGLRVIGAIRNRYDGRKRSPWDEAECGHHYGRAMASWGAIPAWTGFQYSGVTGEMAFAQRKGTWFWSNGSAYGTCSQRPVGKKTAIELVVLAGSLKLSSFALTGKAPTMFTPARLFAASDVVKFVVA